jgi:hypothetical protein
MKFQTLGRSGSSTGKLSSVSDFIYRSFRFAHVLVAPADCEKRVKGHNTFMAEVAAKQAEAETEFLKTETGGADAKLKTNAVDDKSKTDETLDMELASAVGQKYYRIPSPLPPDPNDSLANFHAISVHDPVYKSVFNFSEDGCSEDGDREQDISYNAKYDDEASAGQEMFGDRYQASMSRLKQTQKPVTPQILSVKSLRHPGGALRELPMKKTAGAGSTLSAPADAESIQVLPIKDQAVRDTSVIPLVTPTPPLPDPVPLMDHGDTVSIPQSGNPGSTAQPSSLGASSPGPVKPLSPARQPLQPLNFNPFATPIDCSESSLVDVSGEAEMKGKRELDTAKEPTVEGSGEPDTAKEPTVEGKGGLDTAKEATVEGNGELDTAKKPKGPAAKRKRAAKDVGPASKEPAVEGNGQPDTVKKPKGPAAKGKKAAKDEGPASKENTKPTKRKKAAKDDEPSPIESTKPTKRKRVPEDEGPAPKKRKGVAKDKEFTSATPEAPTSPSALGRGKRERIVKVRQS